MNRPLLLGYDVGSSSIKASLLDAESGTLVASAQSPQKEMKIDAPRPGWAEQHPELWWKHLVLSTRLALKKAGLRKPDIRAIGISYQMHGLVMVDKSRKVLYPSIIWCDSRAVEIGEKAAKSLGEQNCLERCLNTPGNFTASKLRWVQENRPDIYAKVYKVMLPGDYLASRMTDRICTTVSGLSEGIMWDFKEGKVARGLLKYFGFDESLIPEVVPTFGEQGTLNAKAAKELGLAAGITVAYRAGDQPNNALSLNVLRPGEVAATAGTSGVIYGVTDANASDRYGRVNTFAHVNYSEREKRKGVLLCINGTGIQYSWLKQNLGEGAPSYEAMNKWAAKVRIGAEGVRCYPFGNGAERMFRNKDLGAQMTGMNFNIHTERHLIRAAQEGIAFSFRYGLDVLRELGMEVATVKAGDSNLFQSNVFREAFVNTCNVDLEIYNTDGSQGAARGAGIGISCFAEEEAFKGLRKLQECKKSPNLSGQYEGVYQNWRSGLVSMMGN